jgi:heme/copper-type cytochrome/quinol oxidase subunit 2
MTRTSRFLGLLLIGAGTCLLAGPAAARALRPEAQATGQEQPPSRREFDVTASNYRFTPDRVEVQQDELIKLTIRSTDVAYSVTIDEYRVSKRVPAGGAVTLEFRADRAGEFPFYSNLTSDSRHKTMKGQLVVKAR